MKEFSEIVGNLIGEELRLVWKRLLETVKIPGQGFEKIMDRVVSTRGKLFRAALLILTAKLGRASSDRLIDAGAALELIHLASLIHDDINGDSKKQDGEQRLSTQSTAPCLLSLPETSSLAGHFMLRREPEQAW